jgi:Mrp family chromosome partitioning ATPase
VKVVKKAVKMASMLDIPLFGMLENMSYVSCPDCGRRIELFGPSHAKEAAESMGLAFLGSMPIDPQLTALADRGAIEDYQLPLAAELAADIDRAVNRD